MIWCCHCWIKHSLLNNSRSSNFNIIEAITEVSWINFINKVVEVDNEPIYTTIILVTIVALRLLAKFLSSSFLFVYMHLSNMMQLSSPITQEKYGRPNHQKQIWFFHQGYKYFYIITLSNYLHASQRRVIGL